MTTGEMRREWIDDRPYMGASLLERSLACVVVLESKIPTLFGRACELLMGGHQERLADVLGPVPVCDHPEGSDHSVPCTLRSQAGTMRAVASILDAAADVLDPKAVDP